MMYLYQDIIVSTLTVPWCRGHGILLPSRVDHGFFMTEIYTRIGTLINHQLHTHNLKVPFLDTLYTCKGFSIKWPNQTYWRKLGPTCKLGYWTIKNHPPPTTYKSLNCLKTFWKKSFSHTDHSIGVEDEAWHLVPALVSALWDTGIVTHDQDYLDRI